MYRQYINFPVCILYKSCYTYTAIYENVFNFVLFIYGILKYNLITHKKKTAFIFE